MTSAAERAREAAAPPPLAAARSSIRQHMSAYVSICQHTSGYVSIRQQDTSGYVSIPALAAAPRSGHVLPSPARAHGTCATAVLALLAAAVASPPSLPPLSTPQACQYLNFFTIKARKLTTCALQHTRVRNVLVLLLLLLLLLLSLLLLRLPRQRQASLKVRTLLLRSCVSICTVE